MKTTKKLVLVLSLTIVLTVLLTGCMPGDGANSSEKLAGFFTGIWHGWIAPFSLIGSFFKPNLSIYEVHNTGFAYDFGFYMAIISGFGGLSLFRKKHRENNSNN
ncbi:hypothetical protein [Scatolibacter rhodanostii]|uniref:hypothetical protein n=1 Tax=Scatolibacter rhodanostii TaxID=2014781 RepID=UPI000C07E9A3|nr:hypothetical protein [Scatolibacter rhodanostii]